MCPLPQKQVGVQGRGQALLWVPAARRCHPSSWEVRAWGAEPVEKPEPSPWQRLPPALCRYQWAPVSSGGPRAPGRGGGAGRAALLHPEGLCPPLWASLADSGGPRALLDTGFGGVACLGAWIVLRIMPSPLSLGWLVGPGNLDCPPTLAPAPHFLALL